MRGHKKTKKEKKTTPKTHKRIKTTRSKTKKLDVKKVIFHTRPKKLTEKDFDDDAAIIAAGQDQIIIDKYASLVRFIAEKIAARLPASVELDDLISSGVIGLMDAIKKYNPKMENKFKTYAEFRIRGAILDELRAQDWVPRSVRDKAKKLERAYQRLERELERHPTEDEVARELSLSRDEYHQYLDDVKSVSLVSLEELAQFHNSLDRKNLYNLYQQSKSVSPFTALTSKKMKNVILEAINSLPEKQKLVLSLYYYEELNLKEIGQVLAVTESRVSQLHSSAIVRLKMKLKKHMKDILAQAS